MDSITLTKEEFETYVPAFRSPTGEIFAKMGDYISQAAASMEALVADGATVADALLRQLKRATALRAAYTAVPSLDLVLTPTGFGIVSNQNTAPASRERVDALREELRQEASDVEDFAKQSLLAARQLRNPEQHVRSLLWNATLLRQHGVRTADGHTVYREEYEQMAAPLTAAETYVGNIISPELLAALTAQLYAADEPDAVRAIAIEYARRLLSAFLTAGASAHSPSAKGIARLLLGYLREHADFFPEYTSSPTYAAQTYQQYENKKDDATFFFG